MSESSSTSASNIQLIVRCALQSFEDLTITCPMGWKVAELKRHLYDICSTKPDPQRQRLIYAGHCLNDTQTLREIATKASEGFEPGEEVGPQVIHLVCSNPNRDAPQAASGLRHRGNASSTNTNPATTSTASTNATMPAAGQQGYYMHTGFQQYQLPANATPEQMAYYSSLMGYQQALMAWMQYNQFANPAMMPQFMGATPLLQAGPYNVHFNLQVRYRSFFVSYRYLQAGGHGVQPQLVEQNVQNNQPPVAAPANEEEHVNDILGVLYKSIRVIFFLMVLFLYSSFERFLAVFLIICILWYVHRQREQNNMNAAARRVVQAVPQVENENNQGGNDEQAAPQIHQNDNNNNELPGLQPAPQPHQQTAPVQTPWNLFCSTVSSFFLSLIPENPVPLEA